MSLMTLNSTRLPRPRFRYSPVVKAGPWILFSGMIALDEATGALETGGPGPETRKILDNLKSALPDLSLTVHNMALARIFSTRFDQFPAINAAWEDFLADVRWAPARTSVGVSALPLGATVEMEFSFYSEARQ